MLWKKISDSKPQENETILGLYCTTLNSFGNPCKPTWKSVFCDEQYYQEKHICIQYRNIIQGTWARNHLLIDSNAPMYEESEIDQLFIHICYWMSIPQLPGLESNDNKKEDYKD